MNAREMALKLYEMVADMDKADYDDTMELVVDDLTKDIEALNGNTLARLLEDLVEMED